jgi:hypothetical protein
MKLKVTCKIDGSYWNEIIECDSYFIKEGAYIFLKNGSWSSYEYKNVIKTFPVMFTVVERIFE